MIAKWALIGAVLAACVGYLIFSSTATSAQYYRTVAELRRDPVPVSSRVLGTVQDDVQRTDQGRELHFTASDGGMSIPVVFRGEVPDIFRPGIQVVLEGRLQSDGVFHARTLLAKCPSRFSSPPSR
ncbi:MAG: cytochrome c maturation protein CcmE [Candidatus Dormibacteraeota bacterium]|nr:cytochrome c maturation protein CcmE [Candidatus Dormibacteraeota bacterium]